MLGPAAFHAFHLKRFWLRLSFVPFVPFVSFVFQALPFALPFSINDTNRSNR
jgi:hypothetical protein